MTDVELPIEVPRSRVHEALRVLGITEMPGLTDVLIQPLRIQVTYLRRDESGLCVAAGEQIAQVVTDIGVNLDA